MQALHNRAPKALLLDVNGTLFEAAAAGAPAFRELGLDESLVEVRWQLQQAGDGCTLSHSARG